MQDHSQVSVSLSPRMIEEIDRLAKRFGQDQSWVIRHALSEYLKIEGREAPKGGEGLPAMKKGVGPDLDDVLGKARILIASAEARRSK